MSSHTGLSQESSRQIAKDVRVPGTYVRVQCVSEERCVLSEGTANMEQSFEMKLGFAVDTTFKALAIFAHVAG